MKLAELDPTLTSTKTTIVSETVLIPKSSGPVEISQVQFQAPRQTRTRKTTVNSLEAPETTVTTAEPVVKRRGRPPKSVAANPAQG